MRKIDAFFLIPTLLILAVLIFLPLVSVLTTSLTSKPTYSFEKAEYIGIRNYAELLRDERFWNSVWVTIILAFSTITLQAVFGLFLALLLTNPSFTSNFARSILLLPMVLPPVVVGIAWRMFFQPTMPGRSYILNLFGFVSPDWFGGLWTARLVVILATTWQWTPFVMLMLLAGLQSIPQECYQAALIDGASRMQTLWYITLPLLKKVFVFVLIYRTVESMKIFTIVYTMTGGGPGSATEPVNYYIWHVAFGAYRIGYASAVVISTLLIVGFVISVMILYGKKAGVME